MTSANDQDGLSNARAVTHRREIDNLMSALCFMLTLLKSNQPQRTSMSSSQNAQPLERLVYASTAPEPLGTVDLFNILNHARQSNARRGITGHLLYADGKFTQCIEGPPASVELLWQSLLKDPRHDMLQVMERGSTDLRRFAEWSMAFSSYRYLNAFNMPGFFPLDANGQSEKSVLMQK